VPSAIHTGIVDVLEAHPEALTYLLELRGEAPQGPLVPTTGTRTKAFILERRVDRAFLVGSQSAPVGFVLAEVQLDVDQEKGFSWPLYMELGRSRYRFEGALVVLTTAQHVRDWIERDIVPPTGQYGCSRALRPTVLALDAIAPELLLRPDRPYLATLAIAGHANAPDATVVAEAAVDMTLDRLPKRLAADQLDAILGMVNEALRARLERSDHGAS